jgi:Dolichyl-phosphate-mannose-protein mannosyltransferase
MQKLKYLLQKISPESRKIYLALFCILLLAVFVRFFNFSNRIYIGNEQSRDFFVSLVGFLEWQLPLTGPWTSIGPITTGPWYWYYLILMRFFIPHMLSPYIAVALSSLATVAVMYKLGSLLVDRYFGLLTAFIAAIAITLIEGSIYLTNPYFLPFSSSLTLLFFVLNYKQPRLRWSFLTGLLAGISMQVHYQAFGLGIVLISLLIIPDKKLRSFGSAILGFVLSLMPMIFFELSNHYFNSWHLMDFYFNVSKTFYTPRRWLTFSSTTFPQLWADVIGGGLNFGRVVFGASLLTVAGLTWKKKIGKLNAILIAIFLLQIVIIRYWIGEIYVARIQYIVPFILLLTASIIYTALKFNRLFLLLIPLYLVIAAPRLQDYVFKENKDKTEIVDQINQIKKIYPNEKFSLYYCSKDRISRDKKDNFFLLTYIEGAYSENGRKLAIWRKRGTPVSEEECGLPTGLALVIPDVYDINQESEENLAKLGWLEESPKNLYDRSAKWWYQEMP